jgi:hypothetical protein
MALKFDPECSATVEEVRSDKSELNWVGFKYEGKSKILVGGKGSGGYVYALARGRCRARRRRRPGLRTVLGWRRGCG